MVIGELFHLFMVILLKLSVVVFALLRSVSIEQVSQLKFPVMDI